MLAVGVQVISPEVLRTSDQAGLLCGRIHHPRSFASGSSGLVLSESAAVLVLEG